MRRWKVWLLAGGVLLLAAVSFVSFAYFVCIPAIERNLEDEPRVKAVQIEQAAEQYHVLHGKYPDRLEDLTLPDSEHGGKPYLSPDAIRDPWGKPYRADFTPDEAGKIRIWTTTPRGETISNAKKR